jgi:hypothetical protein
VFEDPGGLIGPRGVRWYKAAARVQLGRNMWVVASVS